MKLWLIGKRGMLSSAVQRLLKAKKIDFLATSRKEVDITDKKMFKHQFNTLHFTHVINCSGYTAVDQAELEQKKAMQLNVNAVEYLGHLAAKKQVKVVHFSTDYVFDGKEKNPYVEEAKPFPLSVYGKTKHLGEEKLLKAYPQACVIRTSWLFGREGNHFVQKITHLMNQHQNLRVVSDQKGRMTFCDDLAEAMLDLLNCSGIFHFANKGEVSWYDIANAILTYLKEKKTKIKCEQIEPISTKEYPTLATRPLFSVLATQKYEAKTQKIPRDWQACLKDYFKTHLC